MNAFLIQRKIETNRFVFFARFFRQVFETITISNTLIKISSNAITLNMNFFIILNESISRFRNSFVFVVLVFLRFEFSSRLNFVYIILLSIEKKKSFDATKSSDASSTENDFIIIDDNAQKEKKRKK